MKAMEEAVRTQHGLLRGVFGIRAAAQKPASQIEGSIEMRQDEHLDAHLILRVHHVQPPSADRIAHS
jgi:hypothetical protein